MKNPKCLVALLLSVVMIVLSLSMGFTFPKVQNASEQENNTYESIELLNDVSKDFTFDIVSNSKINDENLNLFVNVTDNNGIIKKVGIRKTKDYYTLYPIDSYIEGKSYNIILKNASFVDARFHNKLTITIQKINIENVEFFESLIKVKAEDVEQIDIEKKVIEFKDNVSYCIGDILLIPTLIPNTDFYVETAYKIEDIKGELIYFSIPGLDEIYSKLEINKTYSAQNVKAYDTDVIIDQILNNPEIVSVSKALNDMEKNFNSQNAKFVNYNTKLTPKKIGIEFKSFDPLDVLVNLEWEITEKLTFTILLRYEKTTTVTFCAGKEEKRQSTKESGKWTVSGSLEYDINDPNVENLFQKVRYRNNYMKNLKDSFDADEQLYDVEEKLKNPNLSYQEKATLREVKQNAQNNVDYANLNKKFLIMENKTAAMIELKTLADYYKADMKESGSVIKFVQLFFPVAPGVAFVTDAGAVLDFSVSAALEAKLIINSINEVGTVTTKNSQSDFHNSRHEVSGFVSICGKIELKLGAQIGVTTTIAGVFNLKLTFEGGIYMKFNALGGAAFGDVDKLDLTEEEQRYYDDFSPLKPLTFIGSVNFEIGAYYLLNYKVSFDLWITEISKTFEIVGEEVPFIKNIEGSHLYKELVFEEEINLDTFEKIIEYNKKLMSVGNLYDSTKELEILPDIGYVNIPKIYIREINLTTGAVSYKLVNSEELLFINQDQVYIRELKCYANDFYAEEIDNRLNIRLNSDKTIDNSYLQVRIIKKPVAIQSFNIRLKDLTNDIGLTEKKELQSEILPYTATYQNFEYHIEKIEKPDLSLYIGDLTKFVKIENNIIETSKDIAIGSKIYISAKTTKNQLISNTLIIEVKRIDIERIDFCDKFQRHDINIGESLSLSVNIYPANATINILNDSCISINIGSSDAAILDRLNDRNFILTAKDSLQNIGKTIDITLTTENYTGRYSYQIGAIPIEKMVLYEAETFTPLKDQISLTRGSELSIRAFIEPVNAAIDNVNYNIFSNTPNFGRFVKIDELGKLVISHDAPLGMEILLSATAMKSSTITHKIIITKRPIESVKLTAENSYIEKNKIMYLNAFVYPSNADVEATQYKLVNNISGVFLSGNMLFASSSAIIDSDIEIIAIVDGIESNILKIRVIEKFDVDVMPSEGDNSSSEEIKHESTGNGEIVIQQEDKPNDRE